MQYEKISCRQTGEEASRVSTRLAQVAGIQDQQAQDDAGATILFWPAAFLIKGDKANTAELSLLKGELDALKQVSIRKSCNMVFHAPVEEPPVEE